MGHSGSGYRATAAAALPANAGRQVVVIDDLFERAETRPTETDNRNEER